ncbi:MAG: CBS domain-containing protein [Dehalococcoidia bacterium]|jgi:CBS domain-containing protein
MDEFYTIEVKDVMIPLHKTPYIEENAGWAVFLKKLSLRAHAWVVNNNEEMKVVGVVTEHDMLRSMIPPGQKKERMVGVPRAEILHRESVVQDIMTHNPIVCSPEETVADVLKKFSSFNIRRLPVVDENKKLLGEVTVQRLLKKLRFKFMNMI